MARWTDGTSHQLIFGEKFIPTWALSTTGSASINQRQWDGSYYYGSEGSNRCFGVARLIHNDSTAQPGRILPKSPSDSYFAENTPPNNYWGHGSFGGHHPKVCQFAIGDGSVRALPVTITPPVLYALAAVNDGASVTLP